MPVELRKRKAHQLPADPPAKKAPKAVKAAGKAKAKPPAAEKPAKKASQANGSSASQKAASKPTVGDAITLDGFGGQIETNEGKKTTLKALVDESKAGVVLFTYPKASTPGCTNQVCLFRDSYADLTAGGLAIYGLSNDSPRANTTFREKQRLPYPLLCDQDAGLIAAIGLAKAPRGTVRGVFAVDKEGSVLLAQPGSPAATVEAVRDLVGRLAAGDGDGTNGATAAAAAAEKKQASKEEEEGAEAEEKQNGEEKKDEPAQVNGNASKEAETDGGKEEKEDEKE